MRKETKINKLSTLKTSSRGQVLVEFAIMLLVLMSLAAGILYISRLLHMDFWSQQEARYMAFEQVWHSHWEASDPYGEAEQEVEDEEYFNKGKMIEGLDSEREVKEAEEDASLGGLLSSLFVPSAQTPNQNKVVNQSPTMLAGLPSKPKSIWHRKTSDLADISFINSAFASQELDKMDSWGGGVIREYSYEGEGLRGQPITELEHGMVEWLEAAEFGETFCRGASRIMAKAGKISASRKFLEDECGPIFNRYFGVYLGEHTDFPSVFLDTQYQIEGGIDSGEAFLISMEKEFAQGFYSFFDEAAQEGKEKGEDELQNYMIETGIYIFGDDQMQDLASFSELRYYGSGIAMYAIEFVMAGMIAMGISGEADWEAEYDDEKLFRRVIFADVNDPLGLKQKNKWLGMLWSLLPIPNLFDLPKEYRPVPAQMSGLMGGMFDGIMANVLFLEEDLKEDLIDNSVKVAEVTYEDGKGLFPAAKKRFKHSDKKLETKFVLLTQPWHITRRKSPTGDFREIGGENDKYQTDAEEATSESMLKKRVFGLYLFPADPEALLEGAAGSLPGVPQILQMSSALNGVTTFIKRFAMDGGQAFQPWIQALQFFEGMTVAGTFSPPNHPMARPDTYPGSDELKNDRSTARTRNLNDFISEQRQYKDREADPKFH